jgi:hypothetical protein
MRPSGSADEDDCDYYHYDYYFDGFHVSSGGEEDIGAENPGNYEDE